jgi:hypothetical protein
MTTPDRRVRWHIWKERPFTAVDEYGPCKWVTDLYLQGTWAYTKSFESHCDAVAFTQRFNISKAGHDYTEDWFDYLGL